MAKNRELEKYKRALGIAVDALMVYGNPEFYHACAFMFDRPTGGFDEDFQRRHGHPDYDRPMPGKLARSALAKLRRYKQLSYYSHLED